MMTFEVSQSEEARLAALRHYEILDTPHETSFDEIVMLAAQIGQAPVSLLSFFDEERQWVKAAYGFAAASLPRTQSLCAQTILQDTPLVISDVRTDEYFRHTPLAAPLRDIRFYAGAPLLTPDGMVIGTLCVMDRFPRSLAPRVRQALVVLARQVMRQLELRRQLRQGRNGNTNSYTEVIAPLPEPAKPTETQELTEQSAFYRALFAHNAAYLCAHDLAGRLIAVNPAAAAALGCVAGELAGRTLEEFVAPATRPLVADFLAQIQRDGAAQGLLRVTDKDGAERTWFYANVLHEKDGQEPLVIGCAFDVTAQRALERELQTGRRQALETARVKSDYLANFGHEIRTPMNGIVSMAHLLARTELSAEQKTYLDLIRDGADTLVTFINDLLDFSKLEAGMMRLETVSFALLGLVENTVTMFAAQAQAKGVELAFIVAADVPAYLQGDPGRLRQILNNLISNAVKFTAQGEIVVQVERAAAQTDEVSVRFTVRDTGSGMDEEFLPHLYQAYTQAHAATAQRFGGTGLGMAIAKQLVEIMQGHIEVESAVGQGTTFSVTLPFSRQTETDTAPTAGPLPDWQGRRVLIVDDNNVSGSILHRQITAWGMAPVNVSAAAEAITVLRQAAQAGEPFTLAILDCEMPEMDGIELARMIHAEPEFAMLPMILLTVFGWRGQGQAARAAGLAAYLTKPVRQAQLFECLITVLGLREEAAPDAPKPFVTRHNLRNYTPLSQPCRVLLVEDNPVNQQVAVHQLYKLGYTADVANNGREALSALAEHEYDVILLDCQMPEMDGYDTAAAIRKDSSQHPFIVALTGYTGAEERAKCLAAGMDSYLCKPVDISELARVLENRDSSLREAVAESEPLVEVVEDIVTESVSPSAQATNEPETVAEEVAPPAPEVVAMDESAVVAEIPSAVSEIVAEAEEMAAKAAPPQPEEIAPVRAAPENAPQLVEVLPTVDLTVLARLISRNGTLKPALAIELIDIFLHDAAAHQAALLEAWPLRDTESLQRASHTLKSSSASMGAKQLAEICANFNKQVAAAKFKEAGKTLKSLKRETERVCAALRTEREKLAQ